MKLLLLNPVSAIAKSKSPKEIKTTIVILLVAWLIIGLSVFIFSRGLSTIVGPSSFLLTLRASIALLTFALGVVGTVFYGFLLQVVITNLGGKGQYYHGLTALTFAKFPIAVGLLAVSVLMLLGPLGVLLSLIVALIFVLMGISTLYRAVKEFFAVDMITAWVGISILVLGTVIAFYILVFGALTGYKQFLPVMTRPGILY